jgi:hypothetical protein
MVIKMKHLNYKLTITSINLLTILVLTLPAFSQTRLQKTWQVSVNFPPTSDRGAPSRTRGTGSRDGICGDRLETRAESQTLIAVTPQNNIVTTISSHPSIYIYISETLDKNAQFRLIDLETEKPIEETDKTFALPNHRGMLKIDLPSTLELKSETPYQWQLLIICNPDNRESDKMLQGWIERTTLNVEQEAKLAETQPQTLARAIVYAEMGIWSEAVDILATLRDQNSEAKTQWTELLESVELGEIAESKIINISQ